ncbi:MAG: hypothetical protein CML35_01940 [Rhodobacteraceae bacterium]|nr:hypothetical protein [Paracoccaceae bacterium]
MSRLEYGPFKIEEAIDLSDLLDQSTDDLDLCIKPIELGIPNLKIFECSLDDLKYLENGRPIICPVTLALAEGEELFAKYKGRVAGVMFKEGEFLKVRRKFNT